MNNNNIVELFLQTKIRFHNNTTINTISTETISSKRKDLNIKKYIDDSINNNKCIDLEEDETVEFPIENYIYRKSISSQSKDNSLWKDIQYSKAQTTSYTSKN